MLTTTLFFVFFFLSSSSSLRLDPYLDDIDYVNNFAFPRVVAFRPEEDAFGGSNTNHEVKQLWNKDRASHGVEQLWNNEEHKAGQISDHKQEQSGNMADWKDKGSLSSKVEQLWNKEEKKMDHAWKKEDISKPNLDWPWNLGSWIEHDSKKLGKEESSTSKEERPLNLGTVEQLSKRQGNTHVKSLWNIDDSPNLELERLFNNDDDDMMSGEDSRIVETILPAPPGMLERFASSQAVNDGGLEVAASQLEPRKWRNEVASQDAGTIIKEGKLGKLVRKIRRKVVQKKRPEKNKKVVVVEDSDELTAPVPEAKKNGKVQTSVTKTVKVVIGIPSASGPGPQNPFTKTKETKKAKESKKIMSVIKPVPPTLLPIVDPLTSEPDFQLPTVRKFQSERTRLPQSRFKQNEREQPSDISPRTIPDYDSAVTSKWKPVVDSKRPRNALGQSAKRPRAIANAPRKVSKPVQELKDFQEDKKVSKLLVRDPYGSKKLSHKTKIIKDSEEYLPKLIPTVLPPSPPTTTRFVSTKPVFFEPEVYQKKKTTKKPVFFEPETQRKKKKTSKKPVFYQPVEQDFDSYFPITADGNFDPRHPMSDEDIEFYDSGPPLTPEFSRGSFEGFGKKPASSFEQSQHFESIGESFEGFGKEFEQSPHFESTGESFMPKRLTDDAFDFPPQKPTFVPSYQSISTPKELEESIEEKTLTFEEAKRKVNEHFKVFQDTKRLKHHEAKYEAAMSGELEPRGLPEMSQIHDEIDGALNAYRAPIRDLSRGYQKQPFSDAKRRKKQDDDAYFAYQDNFGGNAGAGFEYSNNNDAGFALKNNRNANFAYNNKGDAAFTRSYAERNYAYNRNEHNSFAYENPGYAFDSQANAELLRENEGFSYDHTDDRLSYEHDDDAKYAFSDETFLEKNAHKDTFTEPGPPYDTTTAKFALVTKTPPTTTTKTTTTKKTKTTERDREILTQQAPFAESPRSRPTGGSGFPTFPHQEVKPIELKKPKFIRVISDDRAPSSSTKRNEGFEFAFGSQVPPRSTPSSASLPLEARGGGSAPSPPIHYNPITETYKDISRLYDSDVYSSQRFAQLNDFFPPRAGVNVPAIPHSNFPGILRHISSYSRALPFENHHEYTGAKKNVVDFGAATGGKGAFGWYSDHPVHVKARR